MGFQGKGFDLRFEKDPDEVEVAVLDFSRLAGMDTLVVQQATATGVTIDAAVVNSSTLTVSENGGTRTIEVGKALMVTLSGGVALTLGTVHVRVAAGARVREFSFKVLPRST